MFFHGMFLINHGLTCRMHVCDLLCLKKSVLVSNDMAVPNFVIFGTKLRGKEFSAVNPRIIASIFAFLSAMVTGSCVTSSLWMPCPMRLAARPYVDLFCVHCGNNLKFVNLIFTFATCLLVCKWRNKFLTPFPP